MPRLIRRGWLALGLMLFAAGCGAPGAGVQVATVIPELPTSTQVSKMETPTPFTTHEGIPAETIPAVTPTARPMAEPPGNVTVTTETPHVSAVDPSAEDEVAPLEAPTVAVIAEREDETLGVDETGLDRRPTQGQLELLASLHSYGPGPELHSDVWLNSEPLNLADLHGNVILVEFWTFG